MNTVDDFLWLSREDGAKGQGCPTYEVIQLMNQVIDQVIVDTRVVPTATLSTRVYTQQACCPAKLNPPSTRESQLYP